jgi:hypothetical protein
MLTFLPRDFKKWYKASWEPIASPSGLICEINKILPEVEKRFNKSFVYLDKSATFATVFQVCKGRKYS